MTDPAPTLSSIVPLDQAQQSYAVKHTVLVRLAYSIDADRRLNFEFPSIRYYKEINRELFINNIVKGNSLGDEIVNPPKIGDRKHPLEIWISDACYVVVAIEDLKKVRFRQNGPAITAKESGYGQDDCDLRHYDEHGAELRNGPAPGEGCVLSCFTVTRRTPGERHHLNFHLELEQGGGRGWLEIALDPDVPDDGGGVPLPP